MADVVFDLFGNPVRPGKGQRGRPAYEPNAKDRNKIKLLLAVGWTQDRVANALDISLATLKRYYRADLGDAGAMRDRLEASRLIKALEQVEAGGGVAALKHFDAVVDRATEKVLNAKFGDRRTDKAVPKSLGKKEQAAIDAKTAGGSNWGDDLLPINRVN